MKRRTRTQLLVLLGGLILAAGTVASYLAVSGTSDDRAVPKGPVHQVPHTIAADCSRPVNAEISAWLATVPDGARIRFPAKGCFAQDDSIQLRGRNDLVIDGNGSTFRSSAPNDNGTSRYNWRLLLNRNIVLRNLTVIGNFNDSGPPNIDRGSTTTNSGVGIFGNSGILVEDVDIQRVFGDGVTVAIAWYEDHETASHEVPSDIHLTRIRVDRAARHCVTPAQVTGFWLVGSTLNNCYLDGVDAEKDLIGDRLGDLHFIDNTISNYFGVGLVVPIGGTMDAPVTGIEIRGNRFPTIATATACNPPIGVAGYADQYFSDVVIEDNAVLSWRFGIVVERILSGSIRKNKFTHPRESTPNACGPDREDNVIVLNSPGIAVADNR